MNFPHTATVRTLATSGNGYDYSDTATISCFLQPLDSESASSYSIVMTKAFACYVPLSTSVKEGQRLVINGVTYGISGIRTHDYGNLTHKRLILEKA